MVPLKEENFLILTKRLFLWFVRVRLKYGDHLLDLFGVCYCMTGSFSPSPRLVSPFLPKWHGLVQSDLKLECFITGDTCVVAHRYHYSTQYIDALIGSSIYLYYFK